MAFVFDNFAVLQEARVPLVTTGTVVGIISFIGFTPDVLVSPLNGLLLYMNPGVLGHQHVFSGLSHIFVDWINNFASILRKLK
ncbi:MAG: hypothetical protein U5K54_07535 [Cytophagales bacterium]|nr:hypothetical protein [Cytophagales bacterium]